MQSTTGTARPITMYGEEVLHHPCELVTSFDHELAALIDECSPRCTPPGAWALPLTRIGVGLRVFVYDCPDANRRAAGRPPRQSRTAAHLAFRRPGSRSRGLPVRTRTARGPAPPAVATANGFDLNGNPITVSGAGTLARCLQHETDHLNGTRLRRPPLRAASARNPRQKPTFPRTSDEPSSSGGGVHRPDSTRGPLTRDHGPGGGAARHQVRRGKAARAARPRPTIKPVPR